MSSIAAEFDKLQSTEWWPLLEPLRARVEFIERSLDTAYWPFTRDIFRPFKCTKPSTLKCIIIGQDPYPFAHRHDDYILPDADGLSFSAGYSWAFRRQLPPSLSNIYQELKRTHNITATTGDLRPLAEQGVLLLNSALTIRRRTSPRSELSHFQLWRPFISSLLTSIYRRYSKVLVVLVGSQANRLLREGDMSSVHFELVKLPHPSPRNTMRPFVGSDAFIEIDNALRKLEQEPIEWKRLSSSSSKS